MKRDLFSSPAAAQAPLRLPRRPLAVVFDLDGTLIDSERLVGEAYFAAAERHRLPFTQEHFLSLVGQHRDVSQAKMRGYFGPSFQEAEFYADVSAHVGEAVAPLKPGVSDILDRLDSAGAPYALATSSGRPWVERHFRAYQLGPRFRAVVTRHDVVNGKPHPEPYLKASTALGYAPADVLAIEDSPTGVRSAHAAGLMTVMIPDLIQPDDETRTRALHVFSSIGEVASLIGGY